MKLQKDQSKIKSRINYRYYVDVFINIAVYSIIFYVSIKFWIWFIKVIIKMITTI